MVSPNSKRCTDSRCDCSEFEALLQPGPLLGPQPCRVLRTIGQQHPGDDAHDDGRQCLDQEQPLPALQAERPVQRQQPRRHRRPDDQRDHAGRLEDSHHARAVIGREPPGQVQHDARIEARFGQAEHEADAVEGPVVPDEGGEGRDDAPGEQDAGDPLARADTVQDQVAGDLREEVADEEHPGAEAEHRLREVERVLHRQFREADVHAIQVGAEIAQHEHRDQAPGDPVNGLVLQRFDLRSDGSRSGISHDVPPDLGAAAKLTDRYQAINSKSSGVAGSFSGFYPEPHQRLCLWTPPSAGRLEPIP